MHLRKAPINVRHWSWMKESASFCCKCVSLCTDRFSWSSHRGVWEVAFFPHLSKVLGEGLRSVFRFAEGDAVEVVGDVRRAAAELGRSHRHAFSCFPIDGMDAWQVEARARSHEQDQRAGHDPSIVPTHVSAVVSASSFHSFSFPPFLSRIVGAARAHVLSFFWEAFRNVRRVVSNLVDCFLSCYTVESPPMEKETIEGEPTHRKDVEPFPSKGRQRGAAGKRMSSTTVCGCGRNGGGSHIHLVPCRATHGEKDQSRKREGWSAQFQHAHASVDRERCPWQIQGYMHAMGCWWWYNGNRNHPMGEKERTKHRVKTQTTVAKKLTASAVPNGKKGYANHRHM